VGQFALQICAMTGMVPIAIVGSKSKAEFVAEYAPAS
jgi:NADPH-dependent curcumin reductase CurA